MFLHVSSFYALEENSQPILTIWRCLWLLHRLLIMQLILFSGSCTSRCNSFQLNLITSAFADKASVFYNRLCTNVRRCASLQVNVICVLTPAQVTLGKTVNVFCKPAEVLAKFWPVFRAPCYFSECNEAVSCSYNIKVGVIRLVACFSRCGLTPALKCSSRTRSASALCPRWAATIVSTTIATSTFGWRRHFALCECW